MHICIDNQLRVICGHFCLSLLTFLVKRQTFSNFLLKYLHRGLLASKLQVMELITTWAVMMVSGGWRRCRRVYEDSLLSETNEQCDRIRDRRVLDYREGGGWLRKVVYSSGRYWTVEEWKSV